MGQTSVTNLSRTKIIACQTVAEVLRGLLPSTAQLSVLEFGLHLTPEKLHETLQAEVDRSDGDVDTILFGYGMCSKGTLGLEARQARLVIPRCDDCIALFLGSRAEYERQRRIALGTFFLTRGWIEYGGDPYTEYRKMAAKYGDERALRLEKVIMQNYTRVALIDMGDLEERHRQHAQKVARLFDWKVDEIPGSRTLLERLIGGAWDDDFLVIESGGKTSLDMFLSVG